MQIPLDRLDAETLTRLIEEFVSREGTDYGESSPNLSVKVEEVRRKLKSGEAVLVFDEVSESCDILTREAFRSMQKSSVEARRDRPNEMATEF
jgi:uncharacterized protein YheU (UPF0270 family)